MNLPDLIIEVVIDRTPSHRLTAHVLQEGHRGTNMLPGHCSDLAQAMKICRQKISLVLDVMKTHKEIIWRLPPGEHVEEKVER